MKKAIFIILVIIAIAAGAAWWSMRPDQDEQSDVVLYGNVDLRQVNLAFNGSERIAAIHVQEGDRVREGQVLGALEAQKLEANVARAQAKVEAQQHVLERLENGTRPEEIEQARAKVAAAQAEVDNARVNFDRISRSVTAGATSRQSLDDARATLDVAAAKLRVNRKALDLAVAGPRKEDIAEARATLHANEADLASLREDLKNAMLVCPTNGIVQNRVLEPGDMASPQKTVLTIAITDPKWVRAYVPEPDLGRVAYGMKASVASDAFQDKSYDGWVGFISPVAEFTPKSVETTELRTSLVYEVRIFVKDPSDELRLGMPTTVRIPTAKGKQPAKGAGADASKGS
ncbi:MAG: efflux RND transporter periplasmic adaptor subunit [Syntrophobacteraceae bacterium]